ncbi:MAG: histidine kinase [Melioribacteraceae bacterium]|nr:histidine kinase [Melioribacteraceae bacterium]
MLLTFIKVFVLILFSLTYIYSQTPPYYHYTSSNGLASSTVFHMIQDKAGYIWFGTLNGLSRFDGTRFITYRTKDGLNSNSITQILEGEDNQLYLSNFERGINLLSNGKIENLIENIDGKYHTASYMIDYKQKIYAYAPLLSFIVLDKNKFKKDSAYIITSNPILVNKLVVLPEGNLAALTHTGLYDFIDDQFFKISIKGLNDINATSYAKDNDGSYLLGSIGAIYRIKDNTLVEKYNIELSKDIKIENVFSDSKGNIWFSTPGKGFYVIYKGSDEIINLGTKLKLDITHITNFLEDSEGNIWITTFGKGVYCLNNLYLKNYTEYDGLINNNINTITKDNSGRIIIGTFKGINILEKNSLHKLSGKLDKELIGDINSIIVDKNNVYVAWSTNPLYSTRIKYKELQFNITGKRSLLKLSSGDFVYGGWGNDIRISKNFELTSQNPVYYLSDQMQSNRIYNLKEDSKKNLWIASALGLIKLTNLYEKDSAWSWDKTLYSDNQILNSRINYIHEDSKNIVWFAGSKGVASYDLKSERIDNYINVNGFDLSSATSISSDSKNRIWIGTLSGLYFMEGNNIKYLNSKTGLPADEILSLFYDKDEDYLYIGTSNGLSIMDIKLFDSYVYPELNIKINNIKSGDSVYTDYNNLIFEPNQNNIYMDFSVLLYSAPDIIKYRYKLNNQLLETNHNFLNLISLQKGKYELEIAAKTHNTEWGKPLLMKFEVLPHFYETFLFYAVMLFLFIVLIISFAARRIKFNSKKNNEQIELNERINQLKHQALSSMMNPHFTFNALNSVQYLINSKRNEEANNYIAMMAKLIRKHLDTAGSGFILLSEEITRLKLYLNLEKLRFQDRFSYEIINETNIDASSVMIPNMIIQPFVENSLWHGILDSGDEGLLSVSFSFENVDIDSVLCRALIIKVTDNGIGIKTAKKQKEEESKGKEDHISKGIQIVEERLRLLSTKMHIPQPIMFEDLSSHDNNSQGTEVIISLPPTLYRIINSR